MIRRPGMVTLVIALMLPHAHCFAAEPAGQSAQTGFHPYLCISVGSQSLGGSNLSGNQQVTSVKGVFALPELANGGSYAVSLGLRHKLAAIEAAYRQSKHLLSGNSVNGDGRLQAFEIIGRVFTPELGPVRPFLAGGASMDRLDVDNGYCSDSSGTECTARFEGLGFSVGPGLDLSLFGKLFITSRAVYRFTRFDTVESVEAGEGTLPYTITADGWTWLTGIGIGF